MEKLIRDADVLVENFAPGGARPRPRATGQRERRRGRAPTARHIPDRREPIKFSGFRPEITGAPLMGEHTDEVLAGLGYDADAIAKMHADEVA
jgi:crotonobetainyl-CoA:carnitine CoA-transferase CaiB-like acyl-CoA transferase